MIVSFFISKNWPPLAIDTDISIPVSDVFFCRPPGHSLKGVLRCSVFSKTFKTCWFPLYFIYRHFSRIALAIIWCWFFQHSSTVIKVSGFRGQSTENRWQRTRGRLFLFSVICFLLSKKGVRHQHSACRCVARLSEDGSLFLIDTPLPFTYYPFIKA